MKRSDCNKDPRRAQQRAITDLGCASRKLATLLREVGSEAAASALERAVTVAAEESRIALALVQDEEGGRS